jgi:hypothetical protein
MVRIQDPDPNPDPLVRGMDPRIRIHPKMSWIRNTASFIQKYFVGAVSVCFNGGKDCIVMLHLVHAYFQVKITLNKLPGIFNINYGTFPCFPM